MELNIHQNELKSIQSSPMKINWKDFFEDKEDLPFYQKIISEFVFYFIKVNTNESLDIEIESIFFDKCVKFSTFCFNLFEGKRYLTVCVENYCFTILIEEEKMLIYVKRLLKYLTQFKVHFISAYKENYQYLKELIEKTKMEIKIENFIFPSESEQEEIFTEVSQFIKCVENYTNEYPILNITKECISTFIIRRFYYKTKYFRNKNYFDTSKFKEFENKDFIVLRDISENTSLAYYKEENQLVVIKYKEEYNDLERFERDKNLYLRINEMKGFIKYFGYIKNKKEQITSLILEFMSKGTIESYFLKKKEKKSKIDKFKMSFQILERLYLLHSKNIIHRDLKPDNIFLNNNLDIVIGDFDSSRIINKSRTILTTDIGSIIYSSPEMINSQKYNTSTDIYSYGLVLYFIFTEEHPYKSKGEFEIICMKNDLKCKQNEENIPNVLIKSIFSKCISFDPNERPSSDNILDDFVNISYELSKNNQLNLLFYIYSNNNEIIENKLITIYKSLLKNTELIKQNILIYILNVPQNSPKSQQDHLYQSIIEFLMELSIKKDYLAQKLVELILLIILQYRYSNENENMIKLGIEQTLNHLSLSSNKDDINFFYDLGIIYKEKYIKHHISKVIFYLTHSANQNNSKAQIILGKFYYDGKYVSHDINKSIHFLKLSVNQNDSLAQSFLGKIYYEGIYIKRDINKSLYYLTLSSNQNESDAQLYLGQIYYEGKYIPRDINKSIYYLTLSANQNDSEAQFCLGFIYYEGMYIKRDINKSIYYLTLSANQNELYAQHLLGEIYYEGKYIKCDINKSIYYLTLSSNQNNSDSQCFLGKIYFEGKYKARDINKSIYFFTLSANQNNSQALLYLGLIYYIDQHLRNIKKSIYYLSLSANLNDSDAQLLLGVIYLCEFGNINLGINYLILSSNQNHMIAQCFLGELYYRLSFVPMNIKKSIKYLTLSAKQHLFKSQFLLGEIYYLNIYIEKDIQKAIYYFKEASCLNHSGSKNYLGIIYKNGDGVKKNIVFAIEYFKEAIKISKDIPAIYNLSRIYYFGIEIEQNEHKAIKLLENEQNKNTFNQIDFFLFFIYILQNLNEKKAKLLQKIHKTNPKFAVSLKSYENVFRGNLDAYKLIQKVILDFFKNYDLQNYNCKQIYFDEFNFRIDNEIKKSNENIELHSKCQNINKSFHEGFGYELFKYQETNA